MIIKVCGLTESKNLLDICNENIHMIGLNFYPKSPRYVSNQIATCPKNIQKVGVFVNEDIEKVHQTITDFNLDYVQLHGDESVEYCKDLQTSIPIIKVFRVDCSFSYSELEKYAFANYFLFDKRSPLYGGTGQKLDWNYILGHTIPLPFFLSGGIGANDANLIKEIENPNFIGIDINSCFEISPGIKDVRLIRDFIKKLT